MPVTVHKVGLAAHTKTFAQGRAGPGKRARLCQYSALKRSEVTDADKQHAVLDRPSHLLVVNATEYACQAITATGNQGDIGAAGRSAVNGSQASFIVTGETQVAGQRGRIDFHLIAKRLQARQAASKSRLVAHGARGRINVDALLHA